MTAPARGAKGIGIFDRHLTLWVVVCIGAGIVLGKLGRRSVGDRRGGADRGARDAHAGRAVRTDPGLVFRPGLDPGSGG